MTDEDEPAEGVTLIGTEFEVSATEKVSTGEFANNQVHTKLKGVLPDIELDEENRFALKEELLGIHGDLQATVTKAGENRLAERDEWVDWSFLDPVGDEDVGARASPDEGDIGCTDCAWVGELESAIDTDDGLVCPDCGGELDRLGAPDDGE